MIQENAAFEFPAIENVSIFGDSVLTSTGVFPSDHYGVLQIWNLISENNVV